MKLFPDDDRKGRILCHAITADFLYYGTDVRPPPSPPMGKHAVRHPDLCRLRPLPQAGDVVCVLVEDWETVSSFSHAVGVRKVFPDLNGTRLVFIDDKNAGFLLSPSSVRAQCTRENATQKRTTKKMKPRNRNATVEGPVCKIRVDV